MPHLLKPRRRGRGGGGGGERWGKEMAHPDGHKVGGRQTSSTELGVLNFRGLDKVMFRDHELIF